jgi:hypothetical protein
MPRTGGQSKKLRRRFTQMNPCNNRFPLRPAAREEAGLFYSDDQADRTLGLDRPVGRVSFANGERMEFTAPQDYLRTIREELPTRDVTGFRFETLTDDPSVREAVDDILWDFVGEENPRRTNREITFGGLGK